MQKTPWAAIAAIPFVKLLFLLRFCHLYNLGGISSINIALFYLRDKD